MPGPAFGLHFSCQSPDGRWESIYRETLRQAAIADDLGYSSAFVAEHHFLEDGWVPAPMVLLGGIAAVTDDLTIGTDIVVLPLHHPIHVAEQAAVLDLISGGRFRLGVAIGWRDEEFAAYGVDKRERVRRTEEGIEAIRALLSREDVSYDGRTVAFEDLTLTPRPIQDSIPIWVGGQADPAIRRAAVMGDAWITSQIETIDELEEKYAVYEDALAGTGRSAAETYRPLRREAYVAADDETAWAEVGEALLYEYGDVYGDYEDAGHVFDPAEETAIEELRDHARDRFIVGGPETAIDAFQEYHDRLDVDEFLLRMHFPGLDPRHAEKSMRVLADEVMPHVGE